MKTDPRTIVTEVGKLPFSPMLFLANWAPVCVVFVALAVVRSQKLTIAWMFAGLIASLIAYLVIRPWRRRRFVERAAACGFSHDDATNAFKFFEKRAE